MPRIFFVLYRSRSLVSLCVCFISLGVSLFVSLLCDFFLLTFCFHLSHARLVCVSHYRVKLLINRQTGEAVAMKMVDLKKHSDAINSVRKEICIQKMLQDQHILRFFGNRSHGHIEYIFLEYAAGGELFDRIGK